jgi:GT2 family glycosyltransferase
MATIHSILDNTPEPCDFIVVDGNSPAGVQQDIELIAKQHNMKLIRTDEYLTPNAARNLALKDCRTKYIVFADNDILVKPGWISELINCAEETGAALVGPMYLEGAFRHERIHMAGGEARIIERDGRRFSHSTHNHAKKYFWQLKQKPVRQETELLEFHCMLARMDLFTKIGHLDEGLKSLDEHFDVCLQARKLGEKVFFEPASVITYNIDAPFHDSDLEYFYLRWSDDWNWESMQHLQKKWGLDPEDPRLEKVVAWGAKHRRFTEPPTLGRRILAFRKSVNALIRKQMQRLRNSWT